MIKPQAIACIAWMALSSCGRPKPSLSFQAVVGQPSYLLRSPELVETPFPETLKAYGDVSIGWVDLREAMLLRIENAYYKEGAPRRGIANYMGTEMLVLRVMQSGKLKQLELLTLASRVPSQEAVSSLLPIAQQREYFHRFYFQVVVNRQAGTSSALLLSASSKFRLEQLSKQLASDPASVCGGKTQDCTVFPDACSVSLGMEIMVNRQPVKIAWGSTLANVVGQRKQFTLQRQHFGKLVPVQLNPEDPELLRLPFLPGDSISW